MKINHGEIISAAQDYIYSVNDFYCEYPGPNYIDHSNPDLYDAYHSMERAEHVLTVVCSVVGIPPCVAIMAARSINRAYDIAYKAGRDPGTIDEKRVLEALEPKDMRGK